MTCLNLLSRPFRLELKVQVDLARGNTVWNLVRLNPIGLMHFYVFYDHSLALLTIGLIRVYYFTSGIAHKENIFILDYCPNLN